jgi:aspartyl-tRNA synthetase
MLIESAAMASLLETGRTHSCQALRREHVGTHVVLFGWVHRRRDHGGRIFVDLRDREGITQVAFGPDIDAVAHEAADALRSEHCIAVAGTVVDRGSNENPSMATGAVEVEVTALEIFSASDTPPFSIADDDRLDTHENVRLKYRYLDLRRPSFQKNFVTRAKISYITRRTLVEAGFYELETPTMVKYTPGGARNFLVPSRLHPGSFYALAESPQIYKQLFMVAGFEKYFQITRCYRDEDLRNDRQPEFTQIDVELSFATPARVFEVMEALMTNLWQEVLGVTLATPFLRLGWDEAMARFGTDKPDMRFGLELRDATAATRGCGFRVFEAAEHVKGLCIPPDKAEAMGRNQLDKLTDFVKKRENGGAKGLAWVRVKADGSWEAPFAKNVSAAAQAEITAAMGGGPGSLMLFVADTWHTVHTVLNALRLHLRDRLELLAGQEKTWKFLWVTDFPLFEHSDKGWVSSHHPFTSPRPEHVDLLLSEPGTVRAQAYDLVLNGNEIGGGSIRIHRSDVQAKVFEALGLSEAQAQQKFGFLLEAFRYGPPPHGGIALGLDRITMLMCGADSLRDVIAFPKTQRGQDLMTSCPTPADEAQLEELYLRHRPLPGTEE